MKITDVTTILTAPEKINLVVVKVHTSEKGLYGLGCATFTQRYLAVKTAIDDYLKPFVVGKDPAKIEDIWHSAWVSSYWRNGPVLNNALSGIDMALWDIKGKVARMPLYELLGGKCREGVPVYRHADGRDEQEVEDSVRSYMEQGYHYIRCQMGQYGAAALYGAGAEANRPAAIGATPDRFRSPKASPSGAYYDPDGYAMSVPRLFDHLRSTIGFGVELCHDIHERLPPIEAVRLAKALERHRLFFLEDPLPPEQLDWFKIIRSQCSTPLAMGELFANPNDWMPLVTDRLIDFVRPHLSAIGGITPARKLAHLAEAFAIRTAWHGPGDVSPVGHAANIHLDLASPNFGIQEWAGMSDATREVFPGCPEVHDGYVYPNDKPGLGIDIDEKKAASYPCENILPSWTLARTPDGTSVWP